MQQALPPLPQRLKAATLAAADTLTTVAAREGIHLGGERGEALPHLVTILYMLRERCVASEGQSLPWPDDVSPTEIAVVLETIARQMMSDGTTELAGHNANWFLDAALVVEQLARQE